jgi:hypothetical protein
MLMIEIIHNNWGALGALRATLPWPRDPVEVNKRLVLQTALMIHDLEEVRKRAEARRD